MFRYVGVVARKTVEMITRRLLRDALASAIVTIVVTAAFTGFATRSEPPVPPALALNAASVATPAVRTAQVADAGGAQAARQDPMQDALKVWLDPNTVAPNPKGFQRAASRSASGTRKRTAVAAHQPAAPAPRVVAQQAPRLQPLVLESGRADDKALGHRRAHDALASVGPAADKRFRVWGVAPSDLIPTVPSASSIVRSVKSVGTSVAGWMPSL